MNKIEEFWYCVAPQEDLPLYKGQEISSDACTKLIALVNKYKAMVAAGSYGTTDEIINKIIIDEPSIISDMRVLVGVSDKRLYLDLTYLANFYSDENNTRLVPEAREHLLKHDTKYFVRLLSTSPVKKKLAREITTYFVSRGLVDILNTFSSLTTSQIEPRRFPWRSPALLSD